MRCADELVDRPGDEAAGPLRAGRIDARLPRRPDGGPDEPLERAGERPIGEQGPGIRNTAVRHPQFGRGRPVLLEEPGHPRDRRRDPLQQRVTVPRVPDGEGEHVGELPRAVIPQQQQPCVHSAGDRRCESARPWHEGEPLAAVMLDRGAGRRWTLPHENHGGARRVGRREDPDEIAPRPVEVRFDDVQH